MAGIAVPSPKLLKHSSSEAPRLPEIKTLKLRQTMDPASVAEFKQRNTMTCRPASLKKIALGASQSKFNSNTHSSSKSSVKGVTHAQRNQYRTNLGSEVLQSNLEKRSVESTPVGFRMRTINPMRNKSQKLMKTMHNVGSALASARKQLNKQQSDNSDMAESKSLRNLQSDGTQSTNNSSKVNSDSIPREPNAVLRTPAQPLFKSSPGHKIQARNRTLKRPQKVCALSHGQVMINRWMGVLKSKLPQFDLDDQKSNR